MFMICCCLTLCFSDFGFDFLCEGLWVCVCINFSGWEFGLTCYLLVLLVMN